MSIDRLSDDDFLAIEDELLAATGEIPEFSMKLRDNVLNAASGAYRRSRIFHRVQVSAAVAVGIAFCFVLGGFYVSLWNANPATQANIQQTRDVASESGRHQVLSTGISRSNESNDVTPRDQSVVRSTIAD